MEKSPAVMSFHEAEMGDFLGAVCFDKLNLLHGYWQMPVAPEAHKGFKKILLMDSTRRRVFLEEQAVRLPFFRGP